ncbi:nitrogen fixation protein [Jiella sp. MQZ9-1]|uniref:Nitrogen fixation protein n=1 Tax=Jiella flava TaxID=2816857 RepID=A0A939JWT9_9HYPH|nr:type VI secretion system accessory protein TagJ [Jiella flava]MBO0662661.1 nitrogen fixation protein [Jiella flava]MCD2471083.1 nitrogen fixation protein [Jiella flava]
MTLAAQISEALDRNALDEAVAAATAAVRDGPSDAVARNLLIDLLILEGQFERADKQCALASTFSPDLAVGFARLRGELRGMAAREAFFTEGAVPAFPGEPSACDALALRLSVSARKGTQSETKPLLEALEDERAGQAMIVNGTPVADFRDCDDRTPHALEAISSGGAYLWVDFAKIAALTLKPMSRPRDIAFREAELTLHDGSVGTVLVPMLYHGGTQAAEVKLGRETAWQDLGSGITVGCGQRCFLSGDDLLPILELKTLEAAAPADREALHA